MLKPVLHLIIVFSCLLLAVNLHAQDSAEASETAIVRTVCEGKNLGKQLRITVDASQLAILEYDRVTELLYFNIHKGIELTPDLRLKSPLKGLAFAMSPEEALEITRLYSIGVYKLEIIFLPSRVQRQESFCEVHDKHSILTISLLRVSLLDDKGESLKRFYTKRGRLLKAQAIHAVRNYQNKAKPAVIIEIGGAALSKSKAQTLRKAIKQPLYRCYREALEKNGRYQGSIIFRFENGKTRAIHSNKNVIFGNCVTKSIEKNLPINFEKKITLRTIFRLDRK